MVNIRQCSLMLVIGWRDIVILILVMAVLALWMIYNIERRK